jgi:hypothetical protein
MSALSAAPSPAVVRLGQVMRLADIDAGGVARILERHPRTVQRWLKRQASPRPATREVLLALDGVIERLAGVIDPAAAEDWLFTSVPALDGERPVDRIRAGRAGDVLDLIDAIGEGVFA